MPPVRQSQRQRARRVQAGVKTDLDQPAVPGPGYAAAEPVVAATRFATAAPSVTARRRWEADIDQCLDATEQLRREMREMRTLLESLVPSVAASTSQGVSTSQQGAPRVASPVASTSRQRVAPIATANQASGLAPPSNGQ